MALETESSHSNEDRLPISSFLHTNPEGSSDIAASAFNPAKAGLGTPALITTQPSTFQSVENPPTSSIKHDNGKPLQTTAKGPPNVLSSVRRTKCFSAKETSPISQWELLPIVSSLRDFLSSASVGVSRLCLSRKARHGPSRCRCN